MSRLDKLLMALFGWNRTNLYGWVFAGAALFVVSFSLQRRGQSQDALYLILLGIFCLLLQIHCAKIAETLKRELSTRD